MKTDGFGITHDDTCRRPTWVSAREHGRQLQRCRTCGITWAPGDGSLSARPATGYTTTSKETAHA